MSLSIETDSEWNPYEEHERTIESLRQQLAFEKREHIEMQKYTLYLEKRLAEKDAEIARLNADNQNLVLCYLSTNGQAFDSWTQLAASQAREQQLREALEYTVKQVPELATVPGVAEALALPQDTPTIEALVTKAGEVMRERCWHSVPFGQLAVCEAIRALPCVKLEDLK